MSDAHKHSEMKSDKPLVQLMVSMSGASAPEHETEPPGASATSVKAGHEPDQFQVKGILYVPAFVVIVLVVTYLIVSTTFFGILDANKPQPTNNPDSPVVKLNQEPIDKRFERISSSDPHAEVKQPRLEYLKQTKTDPNVYGGDPTYMRSKLPDEAHGNNTPEIRPESLRAVNFIDPTAKRKLLDEYDWADADKKVARIPIGEAMAAVVKKLPVRKDPIKIAADSDDRAKQSNSGRGGPSLPTPTPPAPERKDDHAPKKDGHEKH
ncbi:hypothetical protein [Fimbriiglobus ruber]|uniref:Uncharacterized protein n=1 Tax=Fimbriiglobus ruber TaxID=1908690 RepID=A0A225DJ83_9BACT|nr:hypothetical protein [Fimbriiglobus ruber]OWK36197.1 hypothetical protein FRUB_08760 [Fimbriiglobus ruber]